MKKIFSFILTAILVSIIPFSAIRAQDKKNEKKIKIIVSDGSGTKVIIDTLIKDGSVNEPIVLKDGKVIVIGKPGDESMVRSAGDKEHVFVTVTSDGRESGNIEKSYDVSVSTDDKGDRVEKSTYMIAKDGIVISIEGNDDSKTKDLVKDIEKLMGIDKKDKSGKETVKEETKKVVRK